jgi:hypothetical protein
LKMARRRQGGAAAREGAPASSSSHLPFLVPYLRAHLAHERVRQRGRAVVHVRNHGHVADVGRQVHDGAHLVDCERKKGQGGLSGRFLCLIHPVVASACSRAGAS